MTAKLQSVLRSDVKPLFFALSCAMLVCISFTAKALADDVQNALSVPMENMMMTADGQLVWDVE